MKNTVSNKVVDAEASRVGIHVGVNKQEIDAASAAIMAILMAPNLDQKTKQVALKQLTAALSIGPVTIANNVLTMK